MLKENRNAASEKTVACRAEGTDNDPRPAQDAHTEFERKMDANVTLYLLKTI